MNDKVSNIEKDIEKLKSESSNLDITVRRSNEIQTAISNYKNDTRTLNRLISEKKKEIIKLEESLS